MSFLSKKYFDPYSDTMENDMFLSLSRPSVVANEDNYDYAIELAPDDEYRLVAKTLKDIIGFDDYEFNSSLTRNSAEPSNPSNSANENDATKHFPNNSNCINEVVLSINDSEIMNEELNNDNDDIAQLRDSTNSKDSVVSYQDFLWKMGILQKQKTWVDSIRRKSSLNFQSKIILSDKEARDKFLVMMGSGVHVRRHQGGHTSEIVRLFSNDGCKTIEWSKPRPLDLLRQRKGQGLYEEGNTEAIYATTADRSGFDCCITICGCGDDLLTGNDSPMPKKSQNHAKKSKSKDIRSSILYHDDEAKYQGVGRAWYNFGFKRFGKFEDTDIVTIHPAAKEDPTHLGMLGTESLRSSEDTYEIGQSFSIILRRILSSQGYETLDIECDDENTYFILLRGFYMLREDSEVRRRELLQKQNEKDSTQIIGLRRIFRNIKEFFCPIREEMNNDDPIARLFESSNDKDLFSIFLSPPSYRDDLKNYYPKQSQWLDANKQPFLPPAQFLGWQAAGTQIWARLTMAGLDVKPVYSWDLTRITLKIRCPQWRLEEVAELMHLKLKNRDGTMKRFKVSRRDTFIPVGSDGTIFRSSERQQIIDFIIRSKIKDGGAELDENSAVGRKIIQRFPLHMESRLSDLRHKWVKFWKIEPPGHVSQPWSILTTSPRVTINKISQTISRIWNGMLRQPLDHVAEYFGEDIAFYFAFMAFYTRWLTVPSLLGFVVFCFQIHDQQLDHWLCLPYAICIMVWACVLLAYWRQKSSVFAYRWGVLEYEVEETERPQFIGKYEYDESSGEVRKVYPQYKRLMKYAISIPILSLISLSVLVIMATIFSTQDQLYSNYANREPLNYHPKFELLVGVSYSTAQDTINYANATNSTIVESEIIQLRDPWGTHVQIADLVDKDFWIVTFLYPCLYGIVVDIAKSLFSWGAFLINDFENHRTSTIYTNRLILKIFSFQFITVFTSLYYYAFISKKGEASYLRLSVTIFALMTVGQWYSAFMDLFLPAMYHRIRRYHNKMSISKINRKVYSAREYLDMARMWIGFSNNQINSPATESQRVAANQVNKRAMLLDQARSKVWDEAILTRYSSFCDYTNLVLQLGFVFLFSIVFPLAPLLLLLNNLIMIRLNAIKLCYQRQRPIATKVGGMGVWEDLLQVMSAAGVLTNCGIMAFTSSVLSDGPIGQSLGQGPLVLLLFGLEHVILLFKYWLHVSIPKIPPAVHRARSRDRRSQAPSQSNQSTGKQSNLRKRKSTLSNNLHQYDSHDRDFDRDDGHKELSPTFVPFQGNNNNIDSDAIQTLNMESEKSTLSSSRPSQALFEQNIFVRDDEENHEINLLIDEESEQIVDDRFSVTDPHVVLVANDKPASPYMNQNHVRFSTAGDQIHIINNYPSQINAYSDNDMSSCDEDHEESESPLIESFDHIPPSQFIESEYQDTSYNDHQNIDNADEESDSDNDSLSSAGSNYNESTVIYHQELIGKHIIDQMKADDELAWEKYLREKQRFFQQRHMELIQREESITQAKPRIVARSISPHSNSPMKFYPSTPPTKQLSMTRMNQIERRPSLLNNFVNAMGWNGEKMRSQLNLSTLEDSNRPQVPSSSSRKVNRTETSPPTSPNPSVRHNLEMNSQAITNHIGSHIDTENSLYRHAQLEYQTKLQKQIPYRNASSSITPKPNSMQQTTTKPYSDHKQAKSTQGKQFTQKGIEIKPKSSIRHYDDPRENNPRLANIGTYSLSQHAKKTVANRVSVEVSNQSPPRKIKIKKYDDKPHFPAQESGVNISPSYVIGGKSKLNGISDSSNMIRVIPADNPLDYDH